VASFGCYWPAYFDVILQKVQFHDYELIFNSIISSEGVAARRIRHWFYALYFSSKQLYNPGKLKALCK
jgi:hypothetical protein